jgi:hypothetical protein
MQIIHSQRLQAAKNEHIYLVSSKSKKYNELHDDGNSNRLWRNGTAAKYGGNRKGTKLHYTGNYTLLRSVRTSRKPAGVVHPFELL